MHYFNYLAFRLFAFLIGLLPFGLLYQLSNILAWVLRVVFKYRYKVIKDNLHKAFPSKSSQEKKEILKNYYAHLADILLEGIKGFSMSPAESNKRYIWKNPEFTDKFYKQNRHVIAMASHYGNWEWGTQTIGHQLMHRTLGIVKLVKNPYLNKYLQDQRCAKNVFVADISKTQENIVAFKSEPTLFLFISDQSPRNLQKAQWVEFLGIKTPSLYGADRLARKTGWPVVNIKVERVKRGHYELKTELICEDPNNTSDGEITSIYMSKLEEQIRNKPEHWLWSHRRWKEERYFK